MLPAGIKSLIIGFSKHVTVGLHHKLILPLQVRSIEVFKALTALSQQDQILNIANETCVGYIY